MMAVNSEDCNLSVSEKDRSTWERQMTQHVKAANEHGGNNLSNNIINSIGL